MGRSFTALRYVAHWKNHELVAVMKRPPIQASWFNTLGTFFDELTCEIWVDGRRVATRQVHAALGGLFRARTDVDGSFSDGAQTCRIRSHSGVQ